MSSKSGNVLGDAELLLGGSTEEEDALIVPMLDARRMEVYAEVLDRALKVVRPIQADIVDADTYKEYLDQHHVYFFGNGAAKCMETINHPNAFPHLHQAGRLQDSC